MQFIFYVPFALQKYVLFVWLLFSFQFALETFHTKMMIRNNLLINKIQGMTLCNIFKKKGRQKHAMKE